MISICVPLRNRSNQLLNTLIPSLRENPCRDQFWLSVYDCHSNDIPDLEKKIKDSWDNKRLIYTNTPARFTRSSAVNGAVRQASTEKIFICDADISVHGSFSAEFNKHVKLGQIWFPIVWRLNKGESPPSGKGGWATKGRGMVGIQKTNFGATGGLPTTINQRYLRMVSQRHKATTNLRSWGGEDLYFFEMCNEKFTTIRQNSKELFHHWHPNSKKDLNRYYNT